MTDTVFGALLFGVCLLLIGLRMPVGVAMFVVGGFGFASLAGWSAFLNLLNTAPFGRVSSYTLSVVPLFLLMGQLATRGGLSRLLFDATRACVGHRRGGLAVATIGGCAGFGAVCGSSLATAATMASVALPEMRRHGYSGALAAGTLAGDDGVGGAAGSCSWPRSCRDAPARLRPGEAGRAGRRHAGCKRRDVGDPVSAVDHPGDLRGHHRGILLVYLVLGPVDMLWRWTAWR